MKKLKFLHLVVITLMVAITGFNFYVVDLISKSEPAKAPKPTVLNKKPKDNATYFWFDVRVKINPRDKVYKIIGTSAKIYEGKITAFDRAIWQGLAKRKIVIGPFISADYAEKARTIYKAMVRVNTKDDLRNVRLPKYEHEIYWFAIKFTESPRLRIFVIEHSPARVEAGDAFKFINALFETLQYQQIVIGPFEEYQRTEEVKRLYRKNE